MERVGIQHLPLGGEGAGQELMMTHDANRNLELTVNPAELAALGEGQVAYVKPVLSDDVRRLFPQAPQIQPGLQLFALLSASGAPIMLTASRDAAVANAWANDLETVSLH